MYCLSMTYKKVPIMIRQRFAFTKEESKTLMKSLQKKKLVSECVIVSTCNRMELYFAGNMCDVYIVEKEVAVFKGVSVQEVIPYMYCYQGDSAIRHLYKVAAGMDSMVIGEDEILRQLKEAFFLARDNKMTNAMMNTVFQGAITCAKKIKTDTRLSKIPVSIGTLAAREVIEFQKSGIKNVLIIGSTGKMGTIITKNLLEYQDIQITGTVRSHTTSAKLKSESMIQIDYSRRYEYMELSDVVISVTTCPHYTITYEELNKVIRTRKQRLFLDLSVPLDIDKEVDKIQGIHLYDIDYFTKRSKENNQVKKKELILAEELLNEQLSDVKKAIEFRMFLEHIPKLKKTFDTYSIEQILYQLREKSTSEEFTAILHGFEKL